MAKVYIKRGTRAQLNTAKTNSQLAAGELYLITDESRLAVGTAANTYQDVAKANEADANATYLAAIQFGALV